MTRSITAIFIAFATLFSTSGFSQEVCDFTWLETHWIDSTEYASLEQGVADQFLQMIAVEESEPVPLYEYCIDSLSRAFGNPFAEDSVSIFSRRLDVFAKNYNLTKQLQQYREMTQEYFDLLKYNAEQEKEIANLEKQVTNVSQDLEAVRALNDFLAKVLKMDETGELKPLCFLSLSKSLSELGDSPTLQQVETMKSDFENCQKD